MASKQYILVETEEFEKLHKKLDLLISQKGSLDDFISQKDFMKKYKIAQSTFYKYESQGIFRTYRLGGLKYVKKSEITEELERSLR